MKKNNQPPGNDEQTPMDSSARVRKNIKLIRKIKDLSQDEFAEKLSIKRSALGSYEEGRAEPNSEIITAISETFAISTDRLLKEDLQVSVDTFLFANSANNNARVVPLNPNHQTNDAKGERLRVLAITTDQEGRENIEIVEQKAAAGYLRGYSDREYIRELPKFRLPTQILPSGRSYRAFEIKGDSMLPLKDGSIVVGEYVEDWTSAKTGQTYIVVSETEGIVYKRVENHIEDKQRLRLHSDNPNYPPFDLNVGDITEMWKVRIFIGNEVPSNEVTLDKLMATIVELRSEVQKLTEKNK